MAGELFERDRSDSHSGCPDRTDYCGREDLADDAARLPRVYREGTI